MNKEKDITGNKYNHLTAIKRDGNDSSGCAAWIFQCDCGRYHRTRKKAVTSGQIRRCWIANGTCPFGYIIRQKNGRTGRNTYFINEAQLRAFIEGK